MPFLVGLVILFLLFLFIEKGWDLPEGWAMRATIITIGIGVAGFALILIFTINQH